MDGGTWSILHLWPCLGVIYASKWSQNSGMAHEDSSKVLVITYACTFQLFTLCMYVCVVHVCIWAVLQISYHGISIEKYRGNTVIPFTNYHPMQNPRWYKIVTMLTLSNKHIIRFYKFWFTMYVKLDTFAGWYLSAW